MCSEIININNDIEDAIKIVAEKLKILNPTIKIHEDVNGKCDLGNIYFVSLVDSNNKTIELFIKKAPHDSPLTSEIINKAYRNEACFYTELWPKLQNLQQSFLKEQFFAAIPECFHTIISEEEPHKIVLENLCSRNFESLKRNYFFDRDHLVLVLREYGKFHGLSFALKHKLPDEFLKFSEKFTNVFSEMKEVPVFVESFELIFRECYDIFKNDEDENLRAKLKQYVDAGIEIYFKSQSYSGEKSVFLHGDCWSSNLLIQYNNLKQPSELKFIDFQQMSLGTPIYDISYCLYSAGTEEIFTELEYYIGIYFTSLADMLLRFGLDIDTVYSLETLRLEWKQYCKYGYCMALLLLKNKLRYEKTEEEEEKEVLEEEVVVESMEKGKYDKELLETRARDLIRHMYANDFL